MVGFTGFLSLAFYFLPFAIAFSSIGLTKHFPDELFSPRKLVRNPWLRLVCRVAADALTRRWMGIALMPQAGVALGMALVAAQRFPDLSNIILPVVIGATVLFEVIGPVLTRRALILAGEVPNPSSQP